MTYISVNTWQCINDTEPECVFLNVRLGLTVDLKVIIYYPFIGSTWDVHLKVLVFLVWVLENVSEMNMFCLSFNGSVLTVKRCLWLSNKINHILLWTYSNERRFLYVGMSMERVINLNLSLSQCECCLWCQPTWYLTLSSQSVSCGCKVVNVG